MADELTEFEGKLLKWLIKSDFHIQPWSTKNAATVSYTHLTLPTTPYV